MRSVIRHQVAVGWFALGALLLGGGGLAWKARSTGLIDAHPLSFKVDHGQGLQPGAPVLVRGVQVGEVSDLVLTGDGRVHVTCLIAPRYAPHIHTDAVATIVAPPLLGAVKVEIDPGLATANVPRGAQLATATVRSFLDQAGAIEAKVDSVVARVDAFAVQATETLGKVSDVFQLISESEGLAGQFLHDQELATQVRTALADVAQVTSRLQAEGLDEALATLEEGRRFLEVLQAEDGDHMALVRDLRETIQRLDESLVRADLPGTTAEVRAASTRLGETAVALGETSARMSQRVDPVSEEMQATLVALRQASAAFGRLAEELERQPNSVIFGKDPGESPGLRR